MPSKRKSSACAGSVPALCTHRPSLLPIERLSEAFGLAQRSWQRPCRAGKLVKLGRLEEVKVVTRFTPRRPCNAPKESARGVPRRARTVSCWKFLLPGVQPAAMQCVVHRLSSVRPPIPFCPPGREPGVFDIVGVAASPPRYYLCFVGEPAKGSLPSRGPPWPEPPNPVSSRPPVALVGYGPPGPPRSTLCGTTKGPLQLVRTMAPPGASATMQAHK